MYCIKFNKELNSSKECGFYSQEKNREFFKDFFDIDDNLIFKMYVCPKCNYYDICKKSWFNWCENKKL